MRETWLKPNRRVIAIAMLFATAVGVCAGSLLAFGISIGSWFYAAGGGVLAIVAVVCAAYCVYFWRLPRLCYEDGQLLVFAGSAAPLRVPIDIVEVFFLGSGPAWASPQREDESTQCDEEPPPGPRVANVVVRLSESATDYHQRDLPRDVGRWHDGYIVLRGTWCEPIGHERLNVINRRLVEVHRQRREQQPQASEVTT